MSQRRDEIEAANALSAATGAGHPPRTNERLERVRMVVEVAEKLLAGGDEAGAFVGGGLLRALETDQQLWIVLGLKGPRGSHFKPSELYRRLKSNLHSR